MFSKHFRWSGLFIFLLSLLAIPSVFAGEPPKITLAPAWHPGATLDSIDKNADGKNDTTNPNLSLRDDFRYVDVDIYVTTTVQFWSVQLTCTATPAALTSYDDATNDTLAPLPAPRGDGDVNNFNAPVTWGPAWGVEGSDFIGVVDAYNPTTGARTFTASRMGARYPMGGPNGTRDIFLLATLRYRAKDIAANSTAALTCTSTFLNRNGNPVLVATYTPPPPLPVVIGYVASGTALYQGRTAHAGITADCNYYGDPTKDFAVLTAATGVWTYTTRAQGYYGCEFYGDTTAPVTPGYKPDRYLGATTSFELNGLSYNMLPVTLAGGNVSLTGDALTIDETVNMADINAITGPSSWNKAVTTGDTNGDGKTNQADLTIATSNFDTTELTNSRHILYGMPRDYDVWQHTRVWLGNTNSGGSTSVINTPVGDVADMWPTMSPDGKQIAFIRNTGTPTATIPEMGLYTAPVVNGVAGTPVLVTPANADYFALAPSWSPDGTRIAFVCSWYEDGSGNYGVPAGYLADEGNLCVIDANGRNFRNMSTVYNVWENAKTRIYPPAWLSNNEVVYGGAWHNPTCENTLCYANLQYNDVHTLDPDILTGGVGTLLIADMPVVRHGTLFYRFYDDDGAGTKVIRWADLTWNTYPDLVQPFETRSAPVAPFHMVVDFDTDGPGSGTTFVPLNDQIGYFNVSTTDDNILYYDRDVQGREFWLSYISSHNAGQPAAWSSPFGVYPEDVVGNPSDDPCGCGSFHTPNDPDDQEYGSPLYAHRNTAEWLP